MIRELSESHVWKPGSSSFGAFVAPVGYPSFPFPRRNNLMDWDHLRKFSPCSLWVAICSEGLLSVPWGETWNRGIDTCCEESPKFSSLLIPNIKSSYQHPNSSMKKNLVLETPTSSLVVPENNNNNNNNNGTWNQK